MKTIAIANQKGGTGKTTTAYNLGVALTQQGYRVLMVDFDPQGNLSCYCGIPPEQDLEQTITELLMKVAYEKPLSHRECVYQSKRTDDSAPRVDFIPSNLRLASFELAMGTMMCREVLLKTCLEQYSNQYDYKVINHSSYANGSDNIYYTQRNEGRFVVVESRAPSGYYGDWTDVTKPGAAGSVLGKRAYAFEITKALDGQTLWLGNADYNADITTTNNGGTLIDTGEGNIFIAGFIYSHCFSLRACVWNDHLHR